MPSVLCRVVTKPGRLTFVWGVGDKSFEPIALEGQALLDFSDLARRCRDALSRGVAENRDAPLHDLGRELHAKLFVGERGREVLTWLRGLAASNQIDSLEMAGDTPGRVPWNLVEDPEQPGFWGQRFALGVGRRVNPLRTYKSLEAPQVLLLLDPNLASQLDASPLSHWLLEQKIATISTVEQARERIRQSVPDVVWILAPLEHGAWKIGSDLLSPRDLLELIKAAQAGNSLPIVLSTGVGSLDASGAWGCALSAASSFLPGLVTLEVPASALQAADLGMAVLTAFLNEKAPLGQATRQVRERKGAAGLALAVYAPPDVGVRDTTDAGPQARALPIEPYHPLHPLEREQRALLVGRDLDIQNTALLLEQPNTAGLFIHGLAGSGKSSLVRAGLIPFLEEETPGFWTLRDRSEVKVADDEQRLPMLALRSGGDLAGAFAQGLAAFCETPYAFVTPTGRDVTVNLPELLRAFVDGDSTSTTAIQETPNAVPAAPSPSAAAIWGRLQRDPASLARLLEQVTRDLPFELVIPIEQVEDVILSERREIRHEANAAVLRAMAETSAACIVIATVRTEFFAQISGLLGSDPSRSAWKDYDLPELSMDEIRDVLLSPTSRDLLPYGEGIPAAHFGFGFEDGVASDVLRQIESTATQGGVSALHLAHSIGAYLFETCKVRGIANIRTADRKAIPPGEAVEQYVRHRIGQLQMGSSNRKALEELYLQLGARQPNGIVTRRLVPVHQLKSSWRGSLPLEEAVAKAVDEGPLLEATTLLVDGKEDIYVTVPQESLAVMGVRQDEAGKASAGWKPVLDTLFFVAMGMVLAGALTYFFVKRSLPSSNIDEQKVEKLVREYQALMRDNVENRFPMYNGMLAQADQALRDGNTLRARQLLLTQQPTRDGADPRGYEWFYLWRQAAMEKESLLGHRTGVRVVAISEDGKLLATGDEQGVIHLWDFNEKSQLGAILQGIKGPVQGLAFSPDGKWLAGTGKGPDVLLWETTVGAKEPILSPASITLSGKGSATLLAFVGKGETLAVSGTDPGVTLWDVAGKKIKSTLSDLAGPATALATVPGGVAAADQNKVVVWDGDGKKQKELSLNKVEVAAIAGQKDGHFLLGGSRDGATGVVLHWDGKAKEPVLKARHSDAVLAMAFLPELGVIATGGKDQLIRLHDLKSGREVGRLAGHLAWVRSLAVSPDGKRLASSSFDPAVKLWDVASGLAPRTIKAHDRTLSLAFDPRDRFIASGGNDGLVKVWDPATGAMLAEIKAGGPVHRLAFAASLRPMRLAAAAGNEVVLWDVEGGSSDLKFKELARVQGHKDVVTGVVFDAKGTILVSTARDGSVVLTGVPDGKTIKELKSPTPITAANGIEGLFFAGTASGRIVQLAPPYADLVPLPFQFHQGPITALQLIDKEEMRSAGILSTGIDQTLRQSATKDPKTMEFFHPRVYRTHNQPIHCMITGRGFVVTGAQDGSVKFWDLSLSDERYSTTGHNGPVNALALSRNNQLLASAGGDGVIRFYRSIPRPLYGPAMLLAQPRGAAQAGDGE